MKKICKKCNLEKNVIEFHKNKKYEDGLVIYCKECRKKYGTIYREKYKKEINQRKIEYKKTNTEKVKETNRISTRKYKLNNKEKIKTQSKLYSKKNQERIKISRKLYKENNKEKITKYNLDNKEKIKKYKQNYYQSKKNKINQSIKLKYKNNPLFRLKSLVRNRTIKFLKLKKVNKSSKTFEMIGCTPMELKSHIEKLFLYGMTWKNQSLWHIDHIVPLSSAKNEDDIFKLCHYSNLQPLWSEDNLRKSNKLNYFIRHSEQNCPTLSSTGESLV